MLWSSGQSAQVEPLPQPCYSQLARDICPRQFRQWGDGRKLPFGLVSTDSGSSLLNLLLHDRLRDLLRITPELVVFSKKF
jgi:hypothetical protein